MYGETLFPVELFTTFRAAEWFLLGVTGHVELQTTLPSKAFTAD